MLDRILTESLTPHEFERYTRFRRAGLDKAIVRRLVNQTLSQSVPNTIVQTVRGYTKTFLAELIDTALDVQQEWLASAYTRPERVTDGIVPETEDVGDDETLKQRISKEFRGPLTPDMLREALRRYKRDAVGGATGFMGFSGEGRENVAGRTGGKKLFR